MTGPGDQPDCHANQVYQSAPAGSLTPQKCSHSPLTGNRGMPCWDVQDAPYRGAFYKDGKQPTYHTHKNAKSSSDKMRWQRNASQAKRQDKIPEELSEVETGRAPERQFRAILIKMIGDFPGVPMVKALCFQCREGGFDP